VSIPAAPLGAPPSGRRCYAEPAPPKRTPGQGWNDLRKPRIEVFLFLISLAVLVVCGYYLALRIDHPVTRIPWETSWTVRYDQLDCPPADVCLKAGDQVYEVGGVSYEEFQNDRTQPLMQGDPPFEVLFRRNGQEMRTFLRAEPEKSPFRWIYFIGPVTLPLLFWLTGALAAALGSPRDPRRTILIAFCFNTALFFGAGFIAFSHQGLSHFVTRITGAFFLPLAVHLHLMVPVEVDRKIRRWALPPLYLLAATVALADVLHPLSSLLVYSLTGAGFLASLALLAGRALFRGRPPAVQRGFRLLLVGSALGITPWLVFLALLFLDQATTNPDDSLDLVIALAAALALPNWPLAFLYSLVRPQAGGFELRPNRAMGTYGFWSLYVLAYLVASLALFSHWPELASRPLAATVMISLPFVMIAPVAQPMFQRWLDRRLGIQFDPAQVVSAFAARIPTAFEKASLRRLIEEEILPALLIRQAALLVEGGGEKLEVYSELGLEGSRMPSPEEIELLRQKAGKQLPPPLPGETAPPWPPWIQLVVPLESRNESFGVWLLGRRDPDDDYPPDDRRQIAALANQIAAVVRLQRELDEKSRLQSQLLQSQKMEAVGRLSAGVAHDFNNFLSAILSYSELAADLNPKDPELPRYLGGIREAAEKAAALTSQLLAFSRQQVIAEQLVDLGELVEGLENLLRRVLAGGIELQLERQLQKLPVKIDPGQLEQVLLNLVVNASDAMENGGKIVVSTSLRTVEPAAGHALPAGKWAQLRVSDTGSGIAPEVLEHVFEPFFTTKKLGQGTGLGLAMVYGIVQRAGGQVSIETEVGRGTTFLVYLPLLGEAEVQRLRDLGLTGESGEEEQDWETKPGRGKTVLLVEDEPNVRQATADLLRVHGFAVLECGDGFAALELCDQHDGPIDLLLTDVMMPHLKGPDLADRLLMRRPDMRVLFISGYNEEVLLGQRLEKSGARLVRKPCPTRQLLKEIHLSLER
jgi:signal transduction histidine kinase